jgi:hypothetical protein
MVKIPDDYDWNLLRMSVQPALLYNDALSIDGVIDSIVGQVNKLSDIWEGLNLGWVGRTAQEAQDWKDNYSGVMMEIFGPPVPRLAPQDVRDAIAKSNEQPGVGMLVKFQNGMTTAARNYGIADEGIMNAFKDFMHGIADSTGRPAADGYQPQPGRSYPPEDPRNEIPVPLTEHFPDGPPKPGPIEKVPATPGTPDPPPNFSGS